MVKDGTVTALLKGVKLEAHGGEEHSEEVAAQLAEALKEKARVRTFPSQVVLAALCLSPQFLLVCHAGGPWHGGALRKKLLLALMLAAELSEKAMERREDGSLCSCTCNTGWRLLGVV